MNLGIHLIHREGHTPSWLNFLFNFFFFFKESRRGKIFVDLLSVSRFMLLSSLSSLSSSHSASEKKNAVKTKSRIFISWWQSMDCKSMCMRTRDFHRAWDRVLQSRRMRGRERGEKRLRSSSVESNVLSDRVDHRNSGIHDHRGRRIFQCTENLPCE